MNVEKANEIIAKYMGYNFKDNLFEITTIEDRGGEDTQVFKCWAPSYNYYPDLFSASLDALVPVWVKLKVDIELKIDDTCADEKYFTWLDNGIDRFNSDNWHENIFQSTAIATAKAIEAL